jgi:hypothetical protein
VWTGGYGCAQSVLFHKPDGLATYYFRPTKLFEMKLSFVPKKKKDVLLAVLLMPGRYWMEREYDVTRCQTPGNCRHNLEYTPV